MLEQGFAPLEPFLSAIANTLTVEGMVLTPYVIKRVQGLGKANPDEPGIEQDVLPRLDVQAAATIDLNPTNIQVKIQSIEHLLSDANITKEYQFDKIFKRTSLIQNDNWIF